MRLQNMILHRWDVDVPSHQPLSSSTFLVWSWDTETDWLQQDEDEGSQTSPSDPDQNIQMSETDPFTHFLIYSSVFGFFF